MSGNPPCTLTLFHDPDRVAARKLEKVEISGMSLNLAATQRNLDVEKLRDGLLCRSSCQRIALPMSGYICPNGHVFCWHCAKILFETNMGQCTVPIGTYVPKTEYGTSQREAEGASTRPEQNVDVRRGGSMNVGEASVRVKEEPGVPPTAKNYADGEGPSIKKVPEIPFVKCCLALQRRTDPVSLALFHGLTWKCPRGCPQEILGINYNQHLVSGECRGPTTQTQEVGVGTRSGKRRADEI